MTDDKHTPGPWEIWGEDECPETIPVIEIGRGKIPSPECKQIAYVQCSMSDDEEFFLSDEDQANARLIAQAWTIPELRAALKATLKDIGEKDPLYMDTRWSSVSEARAALALAQEKE